MDKVANPYSYQLIWFDKPSHEMAGSILLFNFNKSDWQKIVNDDFETSYLDSHDISLEMMELIAQFLPRNFSPDFKNYEYVLEVVQSDEAEAMHVHEELVQPLQEARQTIERLKEILNESKPVISEEKVAV